jgi:hypothetical protein
MKTITDFPHRRTETEDCWISMPDGVRLAGQVGTFGISWGGFQAIQTAYRAPKDLKVIELRQYFAPRRRIIQVHGQVDMAFAGPTTTLPHLQAGRMRGIAITSTVRSPLVPHIPTLNEAGVPGYEFTQWYFLLAPATLMKATIYCI